MSNKDLKSNTRNKILIYGGNFLARPLGRLADLNIGNPIEAVIYGGLEIIGAFSKKVKESKYNRLIKAVGTGYYAFSTFSNLLSTINGNLEALAQVPFDASMAYQLGKDTFSEYKGEKNNLINDIKNIPKDFLK